MALDRIFKGNANMADQEVTTINPNKTLWEKGDFTRIAETMRLVKRCRQCGERQSRLVRQCLTNTCGGGDHAGNPNSCASPRMSAGNGASSSTSLAMRGCVNRKRQACKACRGKRDGGP